jgi:negative regulator of sigma E activity
MSDKLKENMSALVDGELGERSACETIDVLLASNELQVHWCRYHVVRDVLRHKVYPDADGKLYERVRRCLADEPLHFAKRRLLPRRWRETLGPVAGVALAASVAVVAILAVRGPQPVPDQPQTVRPPSTQVAATMAPAILPASESKDGRGTSPGTDEVERSRMPEPRAKHDSRDGGGRAMHGAIAEDARADDSRDGGVRAKQDARADDSRDGGVRAKQDARADTTTQGKFRPAALRRLQWNSTEPAVIDRLTGYLVDYSEHVGGPITGMHPYARVVGYDTSGQR